MKNIILELINLDAIVKMLNTSLDYVSHEIIDNTIHIKVSSNKENLCCPHCGSETDKVHCTYLKAFADLPIQGKKVIFHIDNRNMFCVNEKCKQKTFSEQFNFLSSNAKKTKRLVQEIIRIALTQSSVSAANYLSESVVDIKKSSICNYLKKNTPNSKRKN